MSLKISVIRRGDETPEGDVVIDAREPFQFLDVIILGGREIRSIIATGQIPGGIPIGIGKYTKKVVAAVIGGKIYIRGVPLTLYSEMGLLERELVEVVRRKSRDVDVLVEKLKGIVIAERRKYRKSPSLSVLNSYLEGEIQSLPPHLADLVANVDKETLKSVFDKLIEEVY